MVIGTTSHQGYKGQLVPDLEEYVRNLEKDAVYVIGCSADGKHGCEQSYIDHSICISNYQLSTLTVCQKVTFAYEEVWNVL